MRARRHAADAGFTLIETLIATALFLVVIGALATVTAQWLPSWNRGFARVQRTEQMALGIERIMADLAAAEFITPNVNVKRPIFDGTTLGVIFVRNAVGPNAQPGLEIVLAGGRRIGVRPGFHPGTLQDLLVALEHHVRPGTSDQGLHCAGSHRHARGFRREWR